MKTLILIAALAQQPFDFGGTLTLEAASAQDAPARLESPNAPAGSEPSPGVLSPQPPALHDQQRGPAVQTLRDRIRAYRDSGGEPWYVRGKTDAQHLIDDHGWSASELRGLTVAELQLLHGASHTGKIVPGKRETIVSVYAPPEFAKERNSDGYAVETKGEWMYWTDSTGLRWSNQGAGLNYTYYGRFRYRDGRMYEPENAPKIQPVITQPSGHWGWQQQCVGGQCQMVPVWIPSR